MPEKIKIKKIISVGYYSVDILNHSVLQCLSSLPLKMSNDSEFTIFSIREFQTSMNDPFKSNNNMNISLNLNHNLANISDRLKLNKLSLNVKKCKCIVFHKPKKKINPLLIMIDDTIIERVQEFNFLGFIPNEYLNGKNHINKIFKKMSSSIGILNKLKYFLLQQIKILIYNAFNGIVTTKFLYYCMGLSMRKNYKTTEKAIRILSLSKYNADTEPRFEELKLLKVKDILKLQELKFYYKYRNNKLPYYLQKYL